MQRAVQSGKTAEFNRKRFRNGKGGMKGLSPLIASCDGRCQVSNWEQTVRWSAAYYQRVGNGHGLVSIDSIDVQTLATAYPFEPKLNVLEAGLPKRPAIFFEPSIVSIIDHSASIPSHHN